MQPAAPSTPGTPTRPAPPLPQPGWPSRVGVAALLCASAVLVYLLLPRFPAGNLGAAATQGWGLYADTRSFAERLRPEDEDLSQAFADPPPAAAGAGASMGAANVAGAADNGGSSADAAPGLSAALQQDPSIYAYVKAPHPVYLQHQTQTYFDGRSWHALQSAWRRLSPERGQFTLYPGQPGAQVEVAVVKTLPTHVLAPDATVGLRFPAEVLGRDHYDGLSTGQPLQAGTTYHLWLAAGLHRGRQTDPQQAAPDARDLQLPARLDPRVAALAAQVSAGAADPWSKALALEQHLRTQYRYTLSTLAQQNDVPLAEFLFDTRAGHCEFFATALAVMLRTQGIPARMVTGFVASDYNPVTGFYEVKGTHGHAWVQAWADGRWLALEATGAYAPPDEASATPPMRNANQQLQDYLQQLQAEQQRLREQAPGEPGRARTLAEWALAFWQALTAGVQALWQALQWAVPRLAVLAALGAAAWWAGRALWQRHRIALLDRLGWQALRRHRPQGAAADLAFGLRQVQALLARHGLPRPPGTPLERYIARLSHDGLPQRAGLRDEWVTVHRWADALHYRSESAEAAESAETRVAVDMAVFTTLYQRLWHALRRGA